MASSRVRGQKRMVRLLSFVWHRDHDTDDGATRRDQGRPLLATSATRADAGISFDRITPDYSFQKVASAIRQAIARGELKPGDRLQSQRTLQGMFGVSKVTILGALRNLEAEGLVRIQVGRNGGAIVLDPTRHSLSRAINFLLDMERVDLDDVAELRGAIELQSARLAAERATADHIAALEDLIGRLEAHARSADADPAEYLALDLEFHTTLAGASGNGLLSACMEVLYHHLIQHPAPHSGAVQALLNAPLRRLLDQGVKAGRPSAAAEAMAAHLAESRRLDVVPSPAPTPNAPA
jgi:GntR family transcriptional regulator, transcriptional repressor for pyruvate dehydrogenase complex